MVAENTAANFALTTSLRTGTGKGHMRKLRARGVVPCVLYGNNTAWSMQANTGDVLRILKKEGARTSLLTLTFENEEKRTETRKVLIKEVQKDPLGLRVLHVDFHEVNLKQPVRVWVNLVGKGRPAGEMLGGILQKVMHQIEIECLPEKIPHEIGVDVSTLKIGFSLHISDLTFDDGIKAITPAEETIFVVAAPKAQEEDTGITAPEESSGDKENNDEQKLG